ncbi:MAG: hypothetical protein NTX25_09280 [Proteobacteria bacterium]|nr:hypothetical protein [Pseudomonadota bacterium]
MKRLHCLAPLFLVSLLGQTSCKTVDNVPSAELASNEGKQTKKVSLVCIRNGGSREHLTVAIHDKSAYLLDDPNEDGSTNLKLIQIVDLTIDEKGDKANPRKEKLKFVSKKESIQFKMHTHPDQDSDDVVVVIGDVSLKEEKWDVECLFNIPSISYSL